MFQKKWILTLILTGLISLGGCTQEQQNRITRLGVTFFEGNYKVTFANGSHVKSWIVIGGKITSEPQKGYYYFWVRDPDGHKRYVQTPIMMTYIEELPKK